MVKKCIICHITVILFYANKNNELLYDLWWNTVKEHFQKPLHGISHMIIFYVNNLVCSHFWCKSCALGCLCYIFCFWFKFIALFYHDSVLSLYPGAPFIHNYWLCFIDRSLKMNAVSSCDFLFDHLYNYGGCQNISNVKRF